MSDTPEIRYDENGRVMYEPDGPVISSFVIASNFVDVIQGPLGSGKTKALCYRIMRHAQEQAPSRVDGRRKTRWAVVRNTFPDLKRTTMRTWLEVFDEPTYGRVNWALPPTHKIAFGDVYMEVDFLALDKPEDVRKLRSGEYTGIGFNELQYIEKPLFDEAQSRVDRYPPRSEGGATWAGVIADANAPDEDHWLAMMTGQVDVPPGTRDGETLIWPKEWGFYMQPPALIEILDERGGIVGYKVNPEAENLRWLSPKYYARQLEGKSKPWIDSRLMNRIALVIEGSPVWPMFKVETHVAREPLTPIDGYEVVVGLDFGRSPAAVFMQAVNNRVLVQHELLGANEGAVTFAPKVKRFLAAKYPNCPVRLYGDPKGQDKGQADERTAYDIFAANGLKVTPAPGLKMNMIATRVDAVAHLLNEMHDGKPRFVLSPTCPTLKVAMAGRYHNERDEVGELRPCKDRYSNPADGLQYGVLGLGEGRRMVGRDPDRPGRGPAKYRPKSSLRRVA